MGWIEFDGVRYFDVREMQNYKAVPIPEEWTCSDAQNSLRKKLRSDATERLDCISFLAGDVEKAQLDKNDMEMVQRNDRKLREEAAKRRNKGGPKLVYKYEKAQK